MKRNLVWIIAAIAGVTLAAMPAAAITIVGDDVAVKGFQTSLSSDGSSVSFAATADCQPGSHTMAFRIMEGTTEQYDVLTGKQLTLNCTNGKLVGRHTLQLTNWDGSSQIFAHVRANAPSGDWSSRAVGWLVKGQTHSYGDAVVDPGVAPTTTTTTAPTTTQAPPSTTQIPTSTTQTSTSATATSASTTQVSTNTSALTTPTSSSPSCDGSFDNVLCNPARTTIGQTSTSIRTSVPGASAPDSLESQTITPEPPADERPEPTASPVTDETVAATQEARRIFEDNVYGPVTLTVDSLVQNADTSLTYAISGYCQTRKTVYVKVLVQTDIEVDSNTASSTITCLRGRYSQQGTLRTTVNFVPSEDISIGAPVTFTVTSNLLSVNKSLVPS